MGRQVGYGIVCGLGPCIAHFPDLAPGGVTVAVMANDVLHGRAAVAELFSEVLVGFGYEPAWPSVPMRVWADASKMARSKEVEPFLQSFGGIQALKQKLDASGRTTKAKDTSTRCGACRTLPVGCCAGILSRGQ